ncbi:hypothetical protein [Streptomyces griseosporeus]|uniref:hypothetical protein n=1 Tax=Streptomyces griseosporeus TaxID=1910 RepID=UPI0036F4D17F
MCRLQGRYDEARRHHRDALHLSPTFDFPGDEAASLDALAEPARSMGDLDQAIEDHGAALALAPRWATAPNRRAPTSARRTPTATWARTPTAPVTAPCGARPVHRHRRPRGRRPPLGGLLTDPLALRLPRVTGT